MSKILKRGIDFLASLLGLLILSPFLIFIAIWIKLDSQGPVFFTQKRIGIRKSTFLICKFRTMRTDTPKDTPTHLLNDPARFITKSGVFLRRSSLDELPQLFNILNGQMSIVGPRPALWNQDDLISARDKYGANDIKPGLTGWAQINGRDELPIDVKAKLDGHYVEKASFLFDMEIILKTIFSVLRSEGIKEGADHDKEH
jgi:O-antigen biosynthesis protein WbqP